MDGRSGIEMISIYPSAFISIVYISQWPMLSLNLRVIFFSVFNT